LFFFPRPFSFFSSLSIFPYFFLSLFLFCFSPLFLLFFLCFSTSFCLP
jgi:hypothetical protein